MEKKAKLKSVVSLKEFSEQTTVHGLPKILSNDSSVSKCIWLVLFSGATALFMIQGITLLSDYFKHPTRTVLETERLKEFPSVTLCNLRHIDPVLNLLLTKYVTRKIPNSCETNNPKSADDQYLCYLKEKYERQLKTYDLLRIPYKNAQKIKQNYEKEIFFRDILQGTQNPNFMVSAISSDMESRATFAANVLKSRISNPEDFGFEFDHFIIKCKFGSKECAVPELKPCHIDNNGTWYFKRNQMGFKRVYESNHYNCYTFNPSEFLMESMRLESRDLIPEPMIGIHGGLDLVLLADGVYLPNESDGAPDLIGLQVCKFDCKYSSFSQFIQSWQKWQFCIQRI